MESFSEVGFTFGEHEFHCFGAGGADRVAAFYTGFDRDGVEDIGFKYRRDCFVLVKSNLIKRNVLIKAV